MPSSGDTLNHYTILEPLGKGGMGEVFLAHDTRLERNVALKFLHESVRHDTVYRKRLLREAKAAASLDHPFICKIYETGETDDGVFIAMEYVAGQNLRQRLKDAPLSFRESVKIGLEIADALQEAHDKGIVHRDLKPDNILLTPQGHVKVMDFGLAKVTVSDAPTGTLHSQMQTGSGTLALTQETGRATPGGPLGGPRRRAACGRASRRRNVATDAKRRPCDARRRAETRLGIDRRLREPHGRFGLRRHFGAHVRDRTGGGFFYFIV